MESEKNNATGRETWSTGPAGCQLASHCRALAFPPAAYFTRTEGRARERGSPTAPLRYFSSSAPSRPYSEWTPTHAHRRIASYIYKRGARIFQEILVERMPTGTMRRMFVESSSSSSSGSGRDAEPAAVLCAPRPRRVHAQPCSADLILGPPPFLLNASSGSNRKQREGKSKTREEDEEESEEEGGWALFGGSPPARADNPLVHDPHFLLNQRHHAAASDFDLAAVFERHSRTHHHHHVPTTYSNSNSNSHSFAPSYTHAAPAVRIQGFDVAACRGSHGSNGGGRVLSARA